MREIQVGDYVVTPDGRDDCRVEAIRDGFVWLDDGDAYRPSLLELIDEKGEP